MSITHLPDPADDLALRAVLIAAKRRHLERRAERALLEAAEDLTLCCAAAWERLRSQGTTAEQIYAELQKTRFLFHEIQDCNEILGEHIADREPRRRHRYSPRLRFRFFVLTCLIDGQIPSLRHARAALSQQNRRQKLTLTCATTVKKPIAPLDISSHLTDPFAFSCPNFVLFSHYLQFSSGHVNIRIISVLRRA